MGQKEPAEDTVIGMATDRYGYGSGSYYGSSSK